MLVTMPDVPSARIKEKIIPAVIYLVVPVVAAATKVIAQLPVQRGIPVAVLIQPCPCTTARDDDVISTSRLETIKRGNGRGIRKNRSLP
jgi:hypothetical protein